MLRMLLVYINYFLNAEVETDHQLSNEVTNTEDNAVTNTVYDAFNLRCFSNVVGRCVSGMQL